MHRRFCLNRQVIYALGLLAILLCFQPAFAQSDDDNDPAKLFEKGQDAHGKRDFKKAIELYEAAIKLHPEFPEAEFQRAMALLATDRPKEAIEGFHRAVALHANWPLAYATFGQALAVLRADDREAEQILRQAVNFDSKDVDSLALLAELRKRTGDLEGALKMIGQATSYPNAGSLVWSRRATIELAAGDKTAAMRSIDHALELNPDDRGARYHRAEMRIQNHDYDGAIADLRLFEKNPLGVKEFETLLGVAQLYARAGKPEDAVRLLDGLSDADKQRREVIAFRAELAGDAESSPDTRAALEDLLKTSPRDPALLARLGNAYRRVDPAKSQDYYYRANQIDPKNPKYAVGYAAALIQARKFAPAEPILKRVIALTPDDYTAHANLALALYEMKRFAEAVPEYEWLAAAKPEIAVTYFFIATAHDNLGEYQQALDAYGKFLAHADPANNKLEIEKVNLRLPVLRSQIQRGQGVKAKKP